MKNTLPLNDAVKNAFSRKKNDDKKRSMSARKNGVSSVLGMALFFLLFVLAMSFTYIWTQNSSSYADNVKAEMQFDTLRAGEQLNITALNNSSIIVSNPTAHLIVVRQVWNSSHGLVYDDVLGTPVSAMKNVTFNNLISNNSFFKVVTSRGNIFGSTVLNVTASNQPIIFPQTTANIWNVTFWAGNNSNPVGNATWYTLSFSRTWSLAGWGNQKFGFNASTNIMSSATNVNVSITLLGGNYPSNVTISLNGIVTTFTSSNFTSFNVTANQTYPITISYSNNATVTDPQTITIMIVGANFAR